MRCLLSVQPALSSVRGDLPLVAKPDEARTMLADAPIQLRDIDDPLDRPPGIGGAVTLGEFDRGSAVLGFDSDVHIHIVMVFRFVTNNKPFTTGTRKTWRRVVHQKVMALQRDLTKIGSDHFAMPHNLRVDDQAALRVDFFFDDFDPRVSALRGWSAAPSLSTR